VSYFQWAVKILGGAWGVGGLAALALGVFLFVIQQVLKKVRSERLPATLGYRFFRLMIVLAFLLALFSLAVAAIQTTLKVPRTDARRDIEALVVQLKSADATLRRQAVDRLVGYGAPAAEEVARAVREEAAAAAGQLVGQAADPDWGSLLMGLVGDPPWRTPFMEAAVQCLVRIGEPSVAPIFEQLALESAAFEQTFDPETARQLEEGKDLLSLLRQWGFVLGAAERGLQAGILRDVLGQALQGIGSRATPHMLDGLDSPQLLVRLTSLQVLVGSRDLTDGALQLLDERARKGTTREGRARAAQLATLLRSAT
jgi:hypothetical protein